MPRLLSIAPRRAARLALGLAGLGLAAGCTVGPDFQRPAAPVAPAGYAAADAPSAVLGEGPAGRWWEAFGSPELNGLVSRAMAGNPGLAAADATLRRARAHVAEVAGRRLPQADGNARFDHEQINLAAYGFPASGGITNPEFDLYSLGGGISFDPDLWGRNRRALEQARAEGEAQLHQNRAAHLALAGRVVGEYLAIAALNDRLATQQALIAESRRNLALTRSRQQAGSGTMVEVLSAQAQLAADEGELPALRQTLAEARDMLAILLGITPAELGATDYALARLSLPARVPVSLPSELVHKRPDILTAEARLHAAVAGIGIAKANMFPQITLGGSFAQSANTTGSLFSVGSRGFDAFSGVSMPFFHGGSLLSAKRGAEAEARAAAAQYRETVLSAFGQVSDLLSALGNDQAALSSARETATLAERSLALSRRSFEVGNSGILQVLDASRVNQRARITLLEAQTRQFLNITRLYVATAGDWEAPREGSK